MTVGERLVQLREERGYKVRKDFAKEIGIPETTLRNYEKNEREPGHTFLKRMSEYFNVSADYILGLTDEKEVLHQARLKSSEQELIEKYRNLDEHGKEMVDFVIDREYERSRDDEESTIVLTMEEIEKLPIKDRLPIIKSQGVIELRAARNNRRKSE